MTYAYSLGIVVVTGIAQHLKWKNEMETNNLEYALVLTLNSNYILKPLAKAEARGDDIEMELYGPDMESIKAQKKAHLAEMKADGLLIDYNNYEV